jgi:hypothetical protein
MKHINDKVLLIILLVISIPLLFININEYHDWGDDFAQYIDQARHFINGIPYSHFLTGSDTYEPSQKGSGFSLILAPAYFFSGNSIRAFLITVSITLFLLLPVLFSFYKDRFVQATSLLLVIFFAYNYHILRMKAEVMAVFPFMLLLYLCFLLLKKKGLGSFMLLSLSAGMLVSIANKGWIFVVVVLSYLLFQVIRNAIQKKSDKESFVKLLLFLLIPIAFHLLIKEMVLKRISMDDITHYNGMFSFSGMAYVFFQNLKYYFEIFKLFFEQEVWGWANIIIKNTVIILFVIGIINKCRKKFDLIDAFFFLYIFTLLCFDYRQAGIRYLIPVLPLMMMYVVTGIKTLEQLLRMKNNMLTHIFLVMIIASNYINLKNIITAKENISFGPQSKTSVEAFDYIRDHVPSSSVVAFQKPFIINLYADRISMNYDESKGIAELKRKLINFHVDYFLVCSDPLQDGVYDKSFHENAVTDKDLEMVWKNSGFELLEFKK